MRTLKWWAAILMMVLTILLSMSVYLSYTYAGHNGRWQGGPTYHPWRSPTMEVYLHKIHRYLMQVRNIFPKVDLGAAILINEDGVAAVPVVRVRAEIDGKVQFTWHVLMEDMEMSITQYAEKNGAKVDRIIPLKALCKYYAERSV